MKDYLKYIITLLVFGVVFLFVGEQSAVRGVRRSRQLRQTRRELAQTRQAIESARREIRILDNTDSLERFARENYYMHRADEDIYIVKQK